MLENATRHVTYPRVDLGYPSESTVRPVGASTHELRWKVKDSRVVVGRGTYGAPTIILYSAEDRVEIGNYSSIAGGSFLLAGGEHNTKLVSSFPFRFYYLQDSEAVVSDPAEIRYQDAVYKGSLRIGSDVWIGFGAMVLSGVTVGHGAVIGAGAVVASNVPPYAIVVGNPGRVIRTRFDEDTVSRLLASRWWDWAPNRVRQYQPMLQGDPRDFLNEVGKLGADEFASYIGPDPRSDLMESEAVIPVSDQSPGYLRKFSRLLLPPVFQVSMSRVRRAVQAVASDRPGRTP